MFEINGCFIDTYLVLENLIFFLVATLFFGMVGWRWRNGRPFSIPQPLPQWFSVWLYIVLAVGVILPILALILNGGDVNVQRTFIPYFVMLALQIVSESISVRRFQSCVFIMIPCVYLPDRIWQLYTGWTLLTHAESSIWVERLVLIEIALWIFNYGVHLSQIPRLLRWDEV